MYTLVKIIQSLITGGHPQALKQMDETEEGRKEITSIRLKPQTRAYLQAQSDSLGISVSQLINIIVDGVVSIETTPQISKINSIYDRLMLLFENHRIQPMDMSRMLSDFGVTLSKLKSCDTMLDLITPAMIQQVSSWFGTNPKWLSAESDEIYSRATVGWYKNTEGMAASLIEHRIIHRSIDVYAIKRDGIPFEVAEEFDDNKHRLDVGFLLKYETQVKGVSFYKYEVCEFQRWNYDRCREHLKLVFKFIDALEDHCSGVNFYGRSLDDNIIDKLYLRELSPAQLDRELLSNAKAWYPADLTNDIGNRYSKMNFGKFISAFCDSPSKSFIPNKTQSDYIESWEIETFGEDGEKFKTLFLAEGLLKLYEKYHILNGFVE
jgi:hypothetical protein